MNSYQIANIVAIVATFLYGIIDHACSWHEYTNYQKGMFNLIYTIGMMYFFTQLLK